VRCRNRNGCAVNLLVDGTPLTKKISGVGKMQYELIQRIRQDHKQISIQIVTNNSLHSAFNDLTDITTVWRCPRIFWELVILPFVCWNTLADVFWSTRHRLPLVINRKKILVCTVHDLTWKACPRTMRLITFLSEYFLFGRTVKKADMIHCVSHSTAANLHQYYPETIQKTKTIYLGADKIEVKNRRRYKKPFMLFVGTFEPRKNLSLLLKAHAEMALEPNYNLDLVVAGTHGWGRPKLNELIKRYDIADITKVVVSPSASELANLYHGCHFLVLPSIYEGFGLPVVEAMNLGKASLTSNDPALVEIGGNATLKFENNNLQSLKSAINKLISEEAILNDLASNARKRSQIFTWKQSADDLADMITSSLDRKQ